MRVFVAGAGGALGTHVVRLLVAAGHEVVGFTRTSSHAGAVTQAGAARLIIGDALDVSAVRGAIETAKPEAVVHALTAIPKRGPWRASDLERTNELRVTGTRHLLDAAIAVGARRMVVESVVFIYGYGDLGPEWLNEEACAAKSVPKGWLRPSIDALVNMEAQVLDAARKGNIEGVVLRFGGFYGPNAGTEMTAKLLRRRWLPVVKNADDSVIPLIHIEDAAAAVVAALNLGREGRVYNIVDDEPVSLPQSFGLWLRRLPRHSREPCPSGSCDSLHRMPRQHGWAQECRSLMPEQKKSLDGSRAFQTIAPGSQRLFTEGSEMTIKAGVPGSTARKVSVIRTAPQVQPE